MFILESVETLGNSINNARLLHPKVSPVSFGEYVVSGSDGACYKVRCFRENGRKIVDCNCKAGELGRPCKHAAAALALHLYWAAQRAA